MAFEERLFVHLSVITELHVLYVSFPTIKTTFKYHLIKTLIILLGDNEWQLILIFFLCKKLVILLLRPH